MWSEIQPYLCIPQFEVFLFSFALSAELSKREFLDFVTRELNGEECSDVIHDVQLIIT